MIKWNHVTAFDWTKHKLKKKKKQRDMNCNQEYANYT